MPCSVGCSVGIKFRFTEALGSISSVTEQKFKHQHLQTIIKILLFFYISIFYFFLYKGLQRWDLLDNDVFLQKLRLIKITQAIHHEWKTAFYNYWRKCVVVSFFIINRLYKTNVMFKSPVIWRCCNSWTSEKCKKASPIRRSRTLPIPYNLQIILLN